MYKSVLIPAAVQSLSNVLSAVNGSIGEIRRISFADLGVAVKIELSDSYEYTTCFSCR